MSQEQEQGQISARIDLSDVLRQQIRQEVDIIKRLVGIFRTNRRHWNNVYTQSRVNPLPDHNYRLITINLAKKEKQLLRNIRYLSSSIVSAKEQLKEIES